MGLTMHVAGSDVGSGRDRDLVEPTVGRGVYGASVFFVLAWHGWFVDGRCLGTV